MSFTPNIPASGQTLGDSRSQILNNFASLRSTLSNSVQPNHIDVNSSGAGKHIFVQMPVQTPGASNLPASNEGGLITQTLNGNSELYYVRDNVNTYYQVSGPVSAAANGYTVLFGGIIIQWGRISGPISGTFAYPTPFLNTVFSLVITPQSSTSLSYSLNNLTQFNVSAIGAVTLNFIAIGN